MKPKPLAIAGTAILIALGGFFAGRVTLTSVPEKSADATGGPGSSRSASGSTSGIGDGISEKSARAVKRAAGAVGTKAERLEKLEGIVRGENPLDRNRALMAFIDRLDPGDFAEAVANFRALGITDARMNEYSLLLSAWAQVDPLAALDFAKANTRTGFARDTILTSWAGNDPEAAIRWAQSNHTGDAANPYLPGIIRGLVGLDPARATQLLTSMPRSVERGAGLDFMLPHLLQQGAEPTREWIASIKDDALRDGAMMRSARQMAAEDPAGTAKWLLENPGEASQRRMDDVYGTWASIDSQAALASFSTLPAGEMRSDALRGVINGVTTGDPKAGLALMDRYSADVTDDVVRNFLWHSLGSDPALAANQISRIVDPQDRNQTYRRALGEWMKRDSAAATAWIQTNTVPPEIRNELLGNPTP